MMIRKIHTDHFSCEIAQHDARSDEHTVYLYDEDEEVVGLFDLETFGELRDLLNLMWDSNSLWRFTEKYKDSPLHPVTTPVEPLPFELKVDELDEVEGE